MGMFGSFFSCHVLVGSSVVQLFGAGGLKFETEKSLKVEWTL